MNNLLVAQSGGPTSAINATLAGVIKFSRINNKIDTVIGSINGVEGIFNENFINLSEIFYNSEKLDLLSKTPSSGLGSCRYKLKSLEESDEEYKKIIEVFKKNEIKYFVYIGGNDSMDTVYKLSVYCKKNNINDISIMGAPKTIDNDLAIIDHCPGFGSAAKYIATTFAELERDLSVYKKGGVLIVEVMGRNAGWLTASSALSRLNGFNGPNLIYLCEKSFNLETFKNDVVKCLDKNGRAIVAISEGIKDEKGVYISEKNSEGKIDAFGHKYIAGSGKFLEEYVRENIGCKVRSIELNLMQRCASHIASRTDIIESEELGMLAALCATENKTGRMASITRINNEPYKTKFEDIDIEEVANKEKTVPIEWISKDGNDIEDELINYLKPLICGEIDTTYKNGIPLNIKIY